MEKILTFLLLCASTFCTSFSLHAAALRPAGGDDQIVQRLVAAPLPEGEFERAPVQFSWVLDPFAELAATPPFTAQSREYWLEADAAALRAGIDFDTTAPGAVIRVSPRPGAAAVPADGLSVRRAGDSAPVALQKQVSADEFQAEGVPAVAGSRVLQLADEASAGRFRLTLANASGRYLVHVFEPNSAYVMTAQASRSQVLAGESLTIGSELVRGGRVLAAATEGVLMAPDGRTFPLEFTGKTGLKAARVTVPEQASRVPGLWEVHLVAGAVDGEVSIQRDARTAIAVTQPTARLAGSYQFNQTQASFSVPVQAAASGRYQLSGVLYATGPDGVARPVSMAHAAAWLERGKHAITLSFNRDHVPLGFAAPYELRDLALSDQTRMGVLETRAFAARSGAAGTR